jgi:hypothetical protein
MREGKNGMKEEVKERMRANPPIRPGMGLSILWGIKNLLASPKKLM